MTLKQKQALLAYLGYYNGPLDGLWGEGSQRATIAFQRDFGGISVDGICGEKTEKALKHSVAYGIDMNTIKIADQIREKIGKPISINSGLRYKTHILIVNVGLNCPTFFNIF